MAILRSQEGAALVTALMLTMLSLVIALALLTMVTTGTQVSASQKRYRSSSSAAQGGVELLTREIMPRLFQGDTHSALESDYALIDLKLPENDCLLQKLDHPTANWSKCSAAQASADPGQAPDVSFRLSGLPPARGFSVTTSDPAQAPDISFRLSGLPSEKGFSVTTKILDTIPGNSDRSGNDLLELGDSVAGKDEAIHPQHVPAMYNLSVQGVREEEGAREKARLSVLYAF